MEETCRWVDNAVRGWEQGRDPESLGLSLVLVHTRQCGRCRALYGPLLPLLRRDAGEHVRRDLTRTVPSAGFTNAVMGRLAREPSPAARSRSRRVVRAALPIAATIVLLVGVGAGAARYFSPPRKPEVLVHFTLQAPAASQVSLAGDFNGWQPGVLNLKRSAATGVWEITVPLRKGSLYTYNFLIDGQRWVPDPSSRAQVDDGFGGLSSVLRL